MKKLSEQFPKFFAFLAAIGITAGVDESATDVKLSADVLKTLEGKIETEIDAVKQENTALKSGVAETERQLAAANTKLTAIDTAMKAGLAAAKVTEQLEAAAGITKMTEKLTEWGALPGAMSTSAKSEGDDKEETGVNADFEYAQAQLGASKFNLKEKFGNGKKTTI